MRAKNTALLSVAALAVTAAFAIVNAPLPSERPAGPYIPGSSVVITVSDGAPAVLGSPIWDCPDYSSDS